MLTIKCNENYVSPARRISDKVRYLYAGNKRENLKNVYITLKNYQIILNKYTFLSCLCANTIKFSMWNSTWLACSQNKILIKCTMRVHSLCTYQLHRASIFSPISKSEDGGVKTQYIHSNIQTKSKCYTFPVQVNPRAGDGMVRGMPFRAALKSRQLFAIWETFPNFRIICFDRRLPPRAKPFRELNDGWFINIALRRTWNVDRLASAELRLAIFTLSFSICLHETALCLCVSGKTMFTEAAKRTQICTQKY